MESPNFFINPKISPQQGTFSECSTLRDNLGAPRVRDNAHVKHMRMQFAQETLKIRQHAIIDMLKFQRQVVEPFSA